jgi:cobaltochelatase CobT
MTPDLEQRANERHGSAALRAVSGRPTAELRGHRLRVDGHVVSMATPYLTLDTNTAGQEPNAARSRGIADALGLLLRNSDIPLHLELGPTDVFERIVFDVLEQLRCDALAPISLRGVRLNIDAAFDAWSLDARASRVTENRMAMLVFTTTYMARARLLGKTLPEDVDELIESTRGHLGPIIGHALRELPRHVDDQRAFAEPAREIARLVSDVAGDAGERSTVAVKALARHRLLVPADWDTGDAETTETDVATIGAATAAPGDHAASFDAIGDYSVFTREYDTQVTGASLFRPEKLRRLRVELDAMEQAQAISAPRLAQRLLALFGAVEEDDGQLVANPANHELFKRRRQQRTSNTVVTFLIDNSGSMKRQRFRAVAVLVDTFSRALDLAGIGNEVLGFTTGAWSGGRSLANWKTAGEPSSPGRMNEAMHIVYKDFDAGWRRSRSSLAALSDPQHFHEGLDGEALAWAHGRLMCRVEPRKILVMISDGSPTDAATANVNRPGFLDDHLAGVAERIERSSPVELGAIGIDLDMSPYVRNSIDLDLAGTLTLQHYRALEQLFGSVRGSGANR